MEQSPATNSPRIGVLFSGGIDSAILIGDLLRRGQQIVPLYVQTGCLWQADELRSAIQYLQAIARPPLEPLVELAMPLGDLYSDHWSMTGKNVPDAKSPANAVFLPGRNPLLLIKPALWCQRNDVRQLAIGTLASNPFADATPTFFHNFQEVLSQATGQPLEIVRPFEGLTKSAVMQLGRDLPLELTFSCLAPTNGAHCGRCNKCAERMAAFAQLPSGDPTQYAAGPGSR